jgi:hypothetical protein
MDRRSVICGLASFAAGVPTLAHAQSRPVGILPQWGAWRKIPSIVIVSAEDDSRVPAVYEAVRSWNDAFANLDSPFRLGSIAHVAGMISAHEFWMATTDVSALGVKRWQPRDSDLPISLRRVDGDVIVALSEGEFKAFANRWPTKGKGAIIFQCPPVSAFRLPTLASYVIAHELGHVIGLGHNDDPTTLMCGKPAACHGDIPLRYSGRFFRLTEREKVRLLDLYPTTWKEEPRRETEDPPPS